MGNHDEPVDTATWKEAFEVGERGWTEQELKGATGLFVAPNLTVLQVAD